MWLKNIKILLNFMKYTQERNGADLIIKILLLIRITKIVTRLCGLDSGESVFFCKHSLNPLQMCFYGA